MITLQLGMSATKTRGGLERYYFDLSGSLPLIGVGIRGLVFGDPAWVGSAADIESFAPEGSGMLQRWWSLPGAVARVLPQIDLVATHFAPYAFPVLDRIGGRPLVVHFHGPWALESAAEGAGALTVAAKRWLERAVYRRGTRFIVLSRAFAEIIEREYGVPGDAIRIVPGGVDVQRFQIDASRAEARRALGWPINRPIVVTVRRLVHAKGVENLIDAVGLVRREHPDLLTVIVGTGPLAADLRQRVREEGLEHSVRFAGYVPDEQLPMIYRAADLFVVPTIALEGFGLVVLESLACGTPALVTPVAGLPEVVNDLDPALVMPGVDANAIASALGDAISGRLPLPDASACIAYAQRFTWPAIASRVRDVYSEVA